MGKYKHENMGDDLKLLRWLDIRKRIVFKITLLAHKAVMGTAPTYLQESGLRPFSFAGTKINNNLPDSVNMCYTDDMFKTALKTLLFNLTYSRE